MTNIPFIQREFANLTKLPEVETYLEVNELIKAIMDTEEHCGLEFELNYSEGDIVDMTGKKINYVITGTHVGDYENYLSIKSITISYNVTKEEIINIIQAVTSLKDNYDDMPNFVGVDLDDDDEIKARSFYTVLQNFEIFEQALDNLGNDLPKETVEQLADVKEKVIDLRSYIDRGIVLNTVVSNGNKYVPLDDADQFDAYIDRADKAIEGLVDNNPEAAEMLSDVLLQLLKA